MDFVLFVFQDMFFFYDIFYENIVVGLFKVMRDMVIVVVCVV